MLDNQKSIAHISLEAASFRFVYSQVVKGDPALRGLRGWSPRFLTADYELDLIPYLF